jgi:1,2-diacylglycerol 3-beta-glucosyltransferase
VERNGTSLLDAAARRWRHRPPIVVDLIVVIVAILVLGVPRFITVANLVVNAVFCAYFVRHASFAAAAARWSYTDLQVPPIDLSWSPPLSVLVACHNEEVVCVPLVTYLAKLQYDPEALQIVIVDDGSSDNTGPLLDKAVADYPNIEVVHRPPGLGGGKSGALNYVLDKLTGEIVVIFDADHKPSFDVLSRLVRHFRDPLVACVMGRCWISNASETWLAGAIYVDYLSGYLVNEYGRQALFELPAYGGANCAVRYSVLMALGGWNEQTVTEDTDLTLRCVLAGYRVRFDPTAVDAEEGTTKIQRFIKQRYRWARGHQQVFRDYWRPMLRCRYLTFPEKVESIMFLLVYHVPVAISASAVLAVLRLAGVGGKYTVVDVLPLAGLLFVGPMSELAVGMMVDRAPRKWVFSMLFVYPLFVLFTVVCTRSWLDGALGRKYTWVKTVRSGFQAPEEDLTAGGP